MSRQHALEMTRFAKSAISNIISAKPEFINPEEDMIGRKYVGDGRFNERGFVQFARPATGNAESDIFVGWGRHETLGGRLTWADVGGEGEHI